MWSFEVLSHKGWGCPRVISTTGRTFDFLFGQLHAATQWNSTFFYFSLIIEGTTERVLQFIMPIRSIYNQNIGFIEQILFFELYRRVQTMRNLLIDIIFVMKIFFWWPFLGLPPVGLCQYYTKMRCSIIVWFTHFNNKLECFFH